MALRGAGGRVRAAGPALCGLVLAACGGASGGASSAAAAPVEVPERRPTAGERVLGLAPSGADALLEIDLARLRDNPVVGPLVRWVTGDGAGVGGLLATSDLIVIASYQVGQADAAQLVLAVGPDAAGLPGAETVAEGVVALGPPELVARAREVASGREPALAGDRRLLRARALAMPKQAEGAALRAAAHLGFEARLALARELELDAVPVWLSVWVDVADDLAAVALLGADRDAEPKALAGAATRLRERVKRTPSFRRVGLDKLAELATIDARVDDARVLLVIGPRRLGRVVRHALAQLGAPQ
jgi:hypothetical protein